MCVYRGHTSCAIHKRLCCLVRGQLQTWLFRGWEHLMRFNKAVPHTGAACRRILSKKLYSRQLAVGQLQLRVAEPTVPEEHRFFAHKQHDVADR